MNREEKIKFAKDQLETIIKLADRKKEKLKKARSLIDFNINPEEQFMIHKLFEHYDCITIYAKKQLEELESESDE